MEIDSLLHYFDLGARGVIALLLAILWLQMRDVKSELASLRADFVDSLISAPHHRSTRRERTQA